MNWKEHMRDNVRNWLLQDKLEAKLNKNFLLLFGNPYLFQRNKFMSLFDSFEKVGLFYNATHEGNTVSFTEPVFGGPMTSMYVELLPDLGVENIIACGYVGGLTEKAEIGSYVIPTSACAMDGSTRSYYPSRKRFHSTEWLNQIIRDILHERSAKYEHGPIISIDALLVEDDAMVEDYMQKGFCAIDLETACFYALGSRLGLNVAAIHIVTDNPVAKKIDPEKFHEASFVEQIQIALEALRKSLFVIPAADFVRSATRKENLK
jgi:purine-nucleoside phosphorylase